MRAYEKTQPLIALHIPKTGGNSVLQILKMWFPEDRLFFHYKVGLSAPTRHKLPPAGCVYGHFNSARGWGAKEYYPDVNQFITFFREPFDRFLSQWFFLNKLKKTGATISGLEDDPTFEVWLHRRAEEQASGQNSFSFVCHLPFNPISDSIDTVFKKHFVFIGIMERFDDSLACLAKILGTQPLQPLHLNATKREVNGYHEYRPYFEKHFSDEMEIYTQALVANDMLISVCR